MDKNNSKETDLKELVFPFLYQWKYFVAIILLLLLLAFYYIKSTAPVYKIQTSVLIKDAKKMFQLQEILEFCKVWVLFLIWVPIVLKMSWKYLNPKLL